MNIYELINWCLSRPAWWLLIPPAAFAALLIWGALLAIADSLGRPGYEKLRKAEADRYHQERERKVRAEIREGIRREHIAAGKPDPWPEDGQLT